MLAVIPLVGGVLVASAPASASVPASISTSTSALASAGTTWNLVTPAGAGSADDSYFPLATAFDAQPQLDATGMPSGGTGGQDAPSYSSRVGYIDFGANWSSVKIAATWTRYRTWSSGDQTPFAALWWDDDKDSVNEAGLNETSLNFNTAKGLSTGGSTEPWIRDVDRSANPVTPRGRYLMLRSATAMANRAKEFAIVAAPACQQGAIVNGLVRQCIDFPSGVRIKDVPDVQDSFGTAAPPTGTTFADTYTPGSGECSTATHDRYWTRGSDGHVYRSWHPVRTTEVGTGRACSFGHEHGDDPRTSPLYEWSGGVPFGIANHSSVHAGNHRHEDHVGHKVFVQNDWEGVIGNPPDAAAITPTGFRCHWLSKVHMGTHSGDAIGNNEHEYHNNVMCDDGAQRHSKTGWESYAGRNNHTEASVKVLSVWGRPGWVKACDLSTQTQVPGVGREIPEGADTNRQIKCATSNAGWMWAARPTATVSETGHTDHVGAGINELWKPWAQVVTRGQQRIFLSSAYYSVLNPARLYNDGSMIPQRDVDGDGKVDNWIPTLEACLANPDKTACKNLPTFPSDVPRDKWWKHPLSPFNGTVRAVHPKGIRVHTESGKAWFCTDYTGQETSADPTVSTNGTRTCPSGQLLQYIAPTRNLWVIKENTSWGPNRAVGVIQGSGVNARDNGTRGSGQTHEWVRFYPDASIHAPN